MHGTKSRGCGEHQRTLENAQDEILCNSISLLGLNPEVRAENFPYIRQRKTIVRLQQKILIRHPHHNILTMVPSNQPLPAKMRKQAEEMRRIREAREREEREKEALLQAAEEEERWEVERKRQEEEEKQ